jgi:hypothetical protein
MLCVPTVLNVHTPIYEMNKPKRVAWLGIRQGGKRDRRMIRLIEGNAKSLRLNSHKKKGFATAVNLSEAPSRFLPWGGLAIL